jgi:hypothetical protein
MPIKSKARRKDSRRANRHKKIHTETREDAQIKDKHPIKIDRAKGRIAAKIRQKMRRMPKLPTNPYVALMMPLVIVPDDPEAKVVIADAGSIVCLLDQQTLYRERMSPITRRGDELYVRFGRADKPQYGWLTNRLPPSVMKPTQGPTFLVQSKDESLLHVWDGLRLKIARTRKGHPNSWAISWLALNGEKYPRELREVTRFFGGTPIKNEPFDTRCIRLFSLILHTEIDMASAKASAKKSAKKGKKIVAEKPTKKGKKTGKVAPAKAKGEFSSSSRAFDNHIIRRLVKENPRRAGSEKAKIWDRIRKGMTVKEFCGKGGTRGAVRRFIENGWIKLLSPKSGATADE